MGTLPKWVKYGLLGLLGAGAGYALLRVKIGCPQAVVVGAGLAVLPVLAFQPGGWFRKTEG